MNCQEMRKAIDSQTMREGLSGSVRAHVDQCPACEGHAGEMNSLFALLQAQPRVEAPADFDFKLRARIARAEAARRETAGSPLQWLEKLWAGSFSWAQATAAMAAIAMIVSLSTYQIYRNSDSGLPTTGTQVEQVAVANNVVAESQSAAAVAFTPAPARAIAERGKSSMDRPARQAMAAERPVRATDSIQTASNQDDSTWRAFNRERGQMVSTPQQLTLIGAEGSAQVAGKAPAYVPSI